MAGYADYESAPTTPGSSPPDGLAPPWLLAPKGKAWLQAFGGVKDDVVQRVKDAVKARFPSAAPSDALAYIGAGRGIVQGLTEPEVNYRSRLQRAFTLWQWAGTPYGVLSAFYAAGYPNPVIQTQTGVQYSLNGYTGNPSVDLVTSPIAGTVHLGGSPSELWSDFALLVMAPWPSWWGGSAPADGSSDQKATSALITQWKPAHCRCVKMIAVQGPVVGVNITVGATFTVGAGSSVVWTAPN